MRDTLRLAILAVLIFAAGCSGYDRELMGDPQPEPVYVEAATPAPAAEDSMGVGMFDELRYYGQWHHLEPYGWVWRPSVVLDWQPFVNGHWIWTQYGWMWVDYDPWGWATSHYGYWSIDYALGWIWIPDYTWSPVQCDWIIYDDYVCWAPVPPPGTRYKEPWDADKAWVSVPVRKFKERSVGNHREIPKMKSDTPAITRTPPDVRDIERRGPKFSMVEVQLDRRVVGEREFAKVRYPADQKTIIESQRTPIKTIDPTPNFAPLQPPAANNGGDDGATTTSTSKPRSESKSKQPASKGDDGSGSKETKKYKDRKDDSNGGKSKDESSKKEKKGKG
jgi:hypothetical protein